MRAHVRKAMSLKKEKDNSVKREKKPLSKKAKISIIVSSIAIVLLVVGVVLLVVLLPKNGDDIDYNMPSRKIQYEYYIDHEDYEGFYISDAFKEEVPLSEFSVLNVFTTPNVNLSSDLRLSVSEGIEIGAEAEYHFLFKDIVVAVVNVKVVDADKYIYTKEELLSATEDKVYIVKNEIDLSGTSGRIDRFIGSIHFNHNPISGYNAESGGLFRELDGATVTGLDMVNVKGTLNHLNAGNIGVIADYTNNTSIRYSTVMGELNVNSSAKSSDLLYVGGMVGYANATKRKTYQTEDDLFVHLVSFLDLNVMGSGDLRVGGVAGGIRNLSITDSYSYGKINVSVSDSEVSNLMNLYVGGIAGALSHQYDAVTVAYELREGNRLYSYSDVTINVSGGGTHNYIIVGGVFGFLQNYSMANSIYGGKMEVNLTRAHLSVGGIVGKTDNLTSLKMNVRGVETKGEIKVYSLASVYAGGIFGECYGTQYSQVVGAVTPVINTDKAKVQGTQITSQGVAKNNDN